MVVVRLLAQIANEVEAQRNVQSSDQLILISRTRLRTVDDGLTDSLCMYPD